MWLPAARQCFNMQSMIDPVTYRVISQTSEDHRAAVRVPEHTETPGQQLWDDTRSHKDPTKVFKSCELHVLVCLSECEYEQKHERNSVQIVMKVPENNHFIFPFIRSDFILLVVAEVRLQHIDYIHCPIIDPLFCL